jgi:hypothetical protein
MLSLHNFALPEDTKRQRRLLEIATDGAAPAPGGNCKIPVILGVHVLRQGS